MTTTDGLLSRSAGDAGLGERLVVRRVVLAVARDPLSDAVAERRRIVRRGSHGMNNGEMRVRRK